MARRKRSSDSDLVDLAAEFEGLPLIAAIVGAAVVLVLFELVLPVVMASVGQSSLSHINYGKLFAPVVRVIGAILAVGILLFGLKGAIGRLLDGILAARRSRKVFERAIDRPGAMSMTWSQLEDLVGQTYQRLGYEVVRRGGPQPDGGVDLELHRAGERVLVQCKHWKSWQVGVKPVRELWGVAASEGAARAIFVTTGTYTQAARSFAADKALELLDGSALAGLVRAAGSAPDAQQAAAVTNQIAVVCPRCGQPMVRRIARHGPNSGQAFWGCSDYPACRGTLPITD
jgi:restriction system protein